MIMPVVNRGARVNRGQSSVPLSLGAPTGGWNARDSIARMPLTDAALMVNLFPTTSDCTLRLGSTNWATGIGAQINSLMPYNAGAARALFAASGGNVFDVSASGAVGAPVLTGKSSDQWMSDNLATPGGEFLLAVNGTADTQGQILCWNGAAWSNQIITSGASGYTINGAFSNICVTKSRAWLVEKGTLHAWYLPIQSIAGAAQVIDLGPVFRKGGQLVAIASWSVTGGFGAQDMTCFISSEGEIAVYQGIDPSQASSWSLVGLYTFGYPVGPRCFAKSGTDLLLLTQTGLTSMNQGQFFGDASAEKGSLTDKIQSAISSATSLYGNAWGWQVVPFPLANMLLVNVPMGAGSQQQYVMNTLTGAWTAFSGWSANCWAIYNGRLYFGGNGAVTQAWTGYTDNGTPVSAEAITAFTDFQAPGRLKGMQMVRPVISAGSNASVSIGVALDYDTTQPLSSPNPTSYPQSSWGSAIWGQATWMSGNSMRGLWANVAGLGYAVAVHMKVSAQSAFHWASTDVLFEIGGST